jgi:hypothetical protein
MVPMPLPMPVFADDDDDISSRVYRLSSRLRQRSTRANGMIDMREARDTRKPLRFGR